MANFAMGMKKKCTTNKDLDVENISKTNKKSPKKKNKKKDTSPPNTGVGNLQTPTYLTEKWVDQVLSALELLHNDYVNRPEAAEHVEEVTATTQKII